MTSDIIFLWMAKFTFASASHESDCMQFNVGYFFIHYSSCSIAVVLLVSYFCDKELWFMIQCTQAHFLYASLLPLPFCSCLSSEPNQRGKKKCKSRSDNLPMVEMACCFQLHTPVLDGNHSTFEQHHTHTHHWTI